MKTQEQIRFELAARDRQLAKNACAVIAAIGLMGMGVAIGLNAPMPQRTYDLVQFVGEESDIVDYDLSVLDCGTAAAQMSAAGLSVRCEVAR